MRYIHIWTICLLLESSKINYPIKMLMPYVALTIRTYSFIKEEGMCCVLACTFLSWSGIYERKLQMASQDFMNRRIFCHTLISSLIPMQQCQCHSQHKDANVLSAKSGRVKKNTASLDSVKEENMLQNYLTASETTTKVMLYLKLSY